jgi:hypothetical protein
MIIRGYRYRLVRWCNDSYGDPRPVRWLKDRVFYATAHRAERDSVIAV